MTERDRYTQEEIASKTRKELADLKGKVADAFLNDDPNISFDEMMGVNTLIDRELERRADAGDIR